MPETVLSRYRVDRLLGQGGMGEVFAATDLRLARPVALKFCLAAAGDARAKRNMEREARAASQLNHPNIATIYDYEEDEDGRPFLVMELLEGMTLADRMKAGPMPAREILRTGAGVAAALEEAHRHGILHRDIKPSNIFLTAQGQVKVLDFGLARHWPPESSVIPADPDETRTAVVRGTPAYMSPEQACGEPLDERSDLFSLGTVLYECLTGERPFAAATPTATLRQVLHKTPGDPDLHSGVSTSLRRLVMNLLEKNPRHRPASAAEVREALETELRTSGLGRAVKAAGAWAWWRWAAACGFLACVVLAALWLPAALRNDRLPKEAQSYFEDGVRALRDGASLRATKLLEEALRFAPAYAPARARLAQAWFELDNVEKARQQALMAATAGRQLDSLTDAERRVVLAIQYMVADRFAEAEKEFLQLTSGADPPRAAQAWFDLGRLRERVPKAREAAEAYESALKVDATLAAAHLRLGLMASRASRYEEAGRRFSEALRLYRATGNLEGEAEVECQEARLAVRRESWDEATSHIGRALELANFTGNLQQTITALSQQVNVQLGKSRIDEARATAEDALRRARKESVSILIARALLDLANTYLAARQTARAEPFLREALEITTNAGDLRTATRARAVLASYYYEKGEREQALSMARPAMAYYDSQRMLLELNKMQTLVARCLVEDGSFGEAMKLFRSIGDQAAKVGNYGQVALAAQGTALALFRQERFRESMEAYANAAAASRRAANPGNEAAALSAQSSAARRLGDWRQAASLADQAISIARRNGLDSSLYHALAAAAEANADGGRMAQAQLHLRNALRALERVQGKAEPETFASTEELLEDRAGRPDRAASLCLPRAESMRTRDFVWASRQLSCALYLEHAGKTEQASQAGGQLAAVFEKYGMRSSLWMALALAELNHQIGTGRAAAAKREYEQSLTPQDARLYRSSPDVVRLSRRWKS